MIELAGGVLQDDEGRVLLLHRETEGIDQWEVPGGKQELGETLDQTVVRELREELGVEVRATRLSDAKFQYDGRDFRYHYYTVQTDDDVAVQETDVFSELAFVDLKTAEQDGYKMSKGAQELAKLL